MFLSLIHCRPHIKNYEIYIFGDYETKEFIFPFDENNNRKKQRRNAKYLFGTFVAEESAGFNLTVNFPSTPIKIIPKNHNFSRTKIKKEKKQTKQNQPEPGLTKQKTNRYSKKERYQFDDTRQAWNKRKKSLLFVILMQKLFKNDCF